MVNIAGPRLLSLKSLISRLALGQCLQTWISRILFPFQKWEASYTVSDIFVQTMCFKLHLLNFRESGRLVCARQGEPMWSDPDKNLGHESLVSLPQQQDSTHAIAFSWLGKRVLHITPNETESIRIGRQDSSALYWCLFPLSSCLP